MRSVTIFNVDAARELIFEFARKYRLDSHEIYQMPIVWQMNPRSWSEMKKLDGIHLHAEFRSDAAYLLGMKVEPLHELADGEVRLALLFRGERPASALLVCAPKIERHRWLAENGLLDRKCVIKLNNPDQVRGLENFVAVSWGASRMTRTQIQAVSMLCNAAALGRGRMIEKDSPEIEQFKKP